MCINFFLTYISWSNEVFRTGGVSAKVYCLKGGNILISEVDRDIAITGNKPESFSLVHTGDFFFAVSFYIASILYNIFLV